MNIRSLWIASFNPLICIAFVVIILECLFGCEELTENVPSISLESSKAHKPPTLTNTKIGLSAVAEFPEYDPSTATNCWVDINLVAPPYAGGEGGEGGRPAVDIVAVVDRSGSMAGEKLARVKETLLFVVSQLSATDRIGLVVYDDTADLVLHLTRVTAENRPEIEASIEAVEAGGNTNLCGGLLRGMQMVSSRSEGKADVASVLLLTDGLANTGISDTQGILQAMKNPGIVEDLESEPEDSQEFTGTVYTFGFGYHDAEMLKEISQAGNGVYYFIDSNEKIPESFADCLGGLLSTVGQNISLKVELSNGATISEFIAKKTPTYNANKTSAEVSLGDIQSEEQRDILMEIQLPMATGGAVNYATITLSYHNVITSLAEQVVARLVVERTDTGKPRVTNRLIGKQKNRILTIRALEAAQSKAELGSFAESRHILEEAKAELLSSDTRSEGAELGMLDDLEDLCGGMADSGAYHDYGKMRAVGSLQSHLEQRSNFAASAGKVGSYETTFKSEMKEKKGAI